jgi:hypothetical protein
LKRGIDISWDASQSVWLRYRSDMPGNALQSTIKALGSMWPQCTLCVQLSTRKGNCGLRSDSRLPLELGSRRRQPASTLPHRSGTAYSANPSSSRSFPGVLRSMVRVPAGGPLRADSRDQPRLPKLAIDRTSDHRVAALTVREAWTLQACACFPRSFPSSSSAPSLGITLFPLSCNPSRIDNIGS